TLSPGPQARPREAGDPNPSSYASPAIAATIRGKMVAEASSLVQLAPEVVAFATCGFQVEQQVLHVETKLAERVLHQIQNPPPAPGAFDHSQHERLQPLLEFGRQSVDGGAEFDQIVGQFFGGRGCGSRGLAHYVALV